MISALRAELIDSRYRENIVFFSDETALFYFSVENCTLHWSVKKRE